MWRTLECSKSVISEPRGIWQFPVYVLTLVIFFIQAMGNSIMRNSLGKLIRGRNEDYCRILESHIPYRNFVTHAEDSIMSLVDPVTFDVERKSRQILTEKDMS
jgi:hypothetical protein